MAVWPSIKQNLVKIGHLVKHLSGETLSHMNHFVCFSKLYKKKMYLQSKSPEGRKIWMVYPSCSTLLAMTFQVLAMFALVFTLPPPTPVNFVWWCLTYLAQLFQFLSLHTQICIDSHAPSWKRQKNARFTDNYIIVCSQYGNRFMSTFWRPEFMKVASRLICGPVAHELILPYILVLLLKYPH